MNNAAGARAYTGDRRTGSTAPSKGALRNRSWSLVAGVLVAFAILVPATARAQVAPTGATVAAQRVEWSATWPRFRPWEYGGTVAFGAATLYLDRYQRPPERPKWQGGVLFDDTFRSWLRVDTRAGRDDVGRISDLLWLGGSAVPFAVDLPVVLLAHRQPGVAWQLLMMDLEAYAFAGFVNRLLHSTAGRARPSVDDCANDPGYDDRCGTRSNNASFVSGHTLGIATAAGLTCVHHRYLPLYGHPVADAGTCALMVLATAATATTRVMVDRHHATDVLLGATIGFASGYGLPWLLHYRARGASADGVTAGRRPLLVPLAGTTVIGLGVVGML